MKNTNNAMPVETPLVSLVMASYNKAGLIGETMHSLLKQTYSNWELLVVDDCSTDNTLALLAEKFADVRIKVLPQARNQGANYCRNVGITASAGDYIIFLDADDLLAPGCLEQRIEKALQLPEADLLVFAMGVFYSEPGDAPGLWQPVSKQPLKDFLRHELPWSILQPLWKKELLQRLHGFDESFLRLQDVELHTRALFQSGVVVRQFAGTPDCYYRIDEARKNFNAVEILHRYIQSTLGYCRKFYTPARERGLEANLAGTVYKTYQQMLYHKKTGKINATELAGLEQELFGADMCDKLGALKRQLFKFAKLYNLLPLRVPGVNWLIAKMCVL